MAEATDRQSSPSPADIIVAAPSAGAIPIHLVREGEEAAVFERLGPAERNWARAQSFTAAPKRTLPLPAPDGRIAGVLFGVGKGDSGEPSGPAELLLGHLAQTLPAGTYALVGHSARPELAGVAWGLGAYRFQAMKSKPVTAPAVRLAAPDGADARTATAIVEAIWRARDLINLPAGDLGPAELEASARALADRYGADITCTVGDDLLAKGFRMIHAVGRASHRAPRLVDMTWGRTGARKVTLVGKGICFDTGGLDIKPSSGMLLMKKDMGGAASALAVAHMVMALGLDVRLRVLLAVAENSVSGNAFRPGDVLRSRSGRTVEIGNTDAEGRLVLADALDLADEEAPDLMISLATLTGAARVALGPDLPAMFTDDDALAAAISSAGLAVGDPVWRLPLWRGYERNLDSEVADFNNVSDGPFGGAITAALFLRRFVTRARSFAHFDLFGWRPAPRALGPKGGEPHVARAILEHLRTRTAA